MKSLEEEGFGKLFTSEEQKMYGSSDQLGFNHQNVFFKPAPFHLDNKFITRLRDREITQEFYISQFRKPIEDELLACVTKFHPHVKDINITQSMPGMEATGGIFNIFILLFNFFYLINTYYFNK